MKKWQAYALIALLLAVLTFTASLWLRPRLAFAGANSEVIQSLDSLVQLILALGALLAGLVAFLTRRSPGQPGRRPPPGPGRVDTGGGAYVGGKVNTGGGDFTGRDKVVSAGAGGVAVGGKASDNLIVTGDGNQVSQAQVILAPAYEAIQRSDRSEQEKADLTTEVRRIEAEAGKGDQADETFLARRLRNLRRMAPDIAEVALEGPGAVLGTAVRKVAGKVRGEGE